MNDNYILTLLGALNQSKSKKQVNADIRQLEKTINMLRLTATFAKSDTKKELNAYITQLSNQLSTIKLKAKIDNKNLKSEVDKALNNVSFKDIDALNVDGSKAKLKIQKVVSDMKAYAEKTPISVNVQLKKEKLGNDLTTFLNKNSRIKESSVLLAESERIRELIDSVDDKGTLRNATDAFSLFKSEVISTGYAGKSTAQKIKDMLTHITKIGSYFGLASLAVNNFRKSLSTLKSNDSILTEISKTSDLTKQQLKKLGDEAFKVASKFGQLSSNYLLAVQEMARSGYEDMSKELGELSLLAQSAGDMTAENANNYLLATDAAYKYSGSVEKLNAALDGANFISNRNSASLTDIADATRVSASFASNAGVAIDELTAAEATMIATTKRAGSEIGRAFRSIVLNLQQVSGEFDGEIIDEEQLKKVEARCHSLGVELEYMKDGIATLRNPMEVLKDLAEVYNSLPDNSADKQGLISDLGGKYHANALSALLSQWDLYEKMLSEFSQGAGSALEEAEKTAKSWEGRLNSLQNSWDSFINTLTNKEAIMNGVSFFDRLIQGAEKLTDTIGEIPVVLTTLNTAMISMNKNYGITQLVNPETKKLDVQGNIFGIDFTNIKNLKKHFSEAEEVLSTWNDGLTSGKANIETFNSELVKNNAQFKAYLQTTSKDAPASLAGYKQYLQSTGQATDTLRLKTILLNSAITMGIGIAIQLAVTAIDNYIHRLDNAKEALSNTQSELSSVSREIEDTTDKIKELKALDPSSLSITDKEDLQRLKDQNEELRIRQQYLEQQEKYDLQKVADLAKEKYNQKYGNTNRELVDAYKSLYENKSTQSEPASSYLTGGNSSIQTMPYAASKQDPGLLRGSEVLADLIAQYEYYSEAKKEAIQNEDAESIEKYNNKLIELSLKLRDDRKELQGFADDLSATGEPSNELDDIKSQLKMIDDLLVSPGQNLANFINDASLADTKQQLIDLADAGKLTQDELTANFSEVDDYLKQNGLTLEDLISIVKTYKEELSETQDIDITPTISSSIQQLATQLEPQFAKLGEAYQAIFTDKGFTLDDVDNSMLEGLRKSFAEIEEEIGVAFDPSVLNPFFDTLTNEASTADQVQQAFNDLATAYFYSTETLEQLNDETADAIEKQLEEMGVSNAHEVVLDALALKNEELAVSKQYLAETGKELASVSELESAAFIASATSAGICSQQFAALQLQKILCNENWLDSTTDIKGLLMLAEAAGIAGNAIAQLYGLKQGYDTAVTNGDSVAASAINEQMRALKTQLANEVANIGTDVKIDFGKIGGGKSAASKAGKDAGEAYADALKDELSKLNDVIGAIGDIINNQIDLYEDQKDAAVEALEAEKKAAEEALEAEKALVQEQIDAKQDEIDKIKEAAKERKNEIDLQKAQYDLARMQNQRTLLVYTESDGMVYKHDTKEIRSAKEAVTEAQENIKISGLEKEISGLENTIDSLDKKIEESNKYYDDLIEQTEKYWDSLIKGLEDYKSRWDELAKIEEQAKVLALLEQMGISTNDVLSMSESAFQGFKESYLGLLTEMYKGNDQMLDSLSKVAGVDMSSLNGYLLDTKNSIDDLKNTDLSGLSDSFDNVTASAGNTSNAINGSGGSSTKSSGSGNQATGTSSGSGDSLKAAIKDETESAIEDLKTQKDLFNGDEGLTNAVQEVIDKIGGGSGSEGSGEGSQGSEGSSDNLKTAIQQQTEEALNEETGIPAQKRAWEELNDPLNQAVDHITTIKSTLEDLDGKTFTVTLNVAGNGGALFSGEISGTYDSGSGSDHSHGGGGKSRVNGTAYIEGTANAKGNWGAKEGGRTLVGELGQELWVHSADGTFETVGNNGAEFINLKPNDIIFNHLQTKQLLDKGNIIGRGKVNGGALANGTASGKSVNTIDDIIITEDGHVLRPIQPGDRAWELQKAFEPLLKKIDGNLEYLAGNAMIEHNRQMEQWTKEIMNNTAINNITNNRNVQPVVNQEFHITMPNVTNSTCAETLMKDLQSLATKKFQVKW